MTDIAVKIQILPEFFSEALLLKWSEIFLSPGKNKVCQPKFLYSVKKKKYFKNKSEKKKQFCGREFISSRPVLQEMLEEVLQTQEYDTRQKLGPT